MGLQHLNITLPDEIAELVRAKVAAGEYATESDVIQESLQSLSPRDQAFESWLAESVAPAYDALIANPKRAANADHVRARIQSLRKG